MVTEDEMIESISKRQVIRYIDGKNFSHKDQIENTDNFAEFLAEHSKYHKAILSLIKCGEGG